MKNQLKTENGLLVKIEFTCSKGIAGYVQILPDKWIDCKWEVFGRKYIRVIL